jgi:ribosomal peptide maturation radical SAM protein 1
MRAGEGSRAGSVALVSMPFAFIETPSMGPSLLRARLEDDGVPAQVSYLTLDFARRVGRETYDAIAHQPGISCLAGDWLFAEQLHDRTEAEREGFLAAVRDGTIGTAASGRHDVEAFVRHLETAARAIPAFLDDWCERLLAQRPRIVGFTSVFQQHVASLALARRLRERDPDVFLVMGGPACDDVMGVETAARFPELSAVVYGEADEAFAALVARVLAGEPVDDLPGVYTPEKAARTPRQPGRCESTAPIRELDALPAVAYDDYLASLRASGLAGAVRPELMIEAARGCWWGAKHHCTFCGLNDVTMAYRHKSACRVVREIEGLHALAPGALLFFTDPIFHMGHFRDLLPELAARGAPASLFFETKANLREELVAWDTRPCAREPRAAFSGAARDAFLASAAPSERPALAEALEDLEDRGLLFRDGDALVNLAVDASRYPELGATPDVTYVRHQKLALLERVRELAGGTVREEALAHA